MTIPRQTSVSATVIGCVALLIWSMSGVFIANLKNIPIFEILTVTYGISFFLTTLYLTARKNWSKIKQPWHIFLIGALGMCACDGLYIAAYKHAPPAHVDTIYYLWPIMTLIFGNILLKEDFTLKHFIATFLSVCGIFWLLNGQDLSSSQMSYFQGYGLAFADAVVCALYTLSLRYFKDVPHEMMGIYCGCAMVFSFFNHLATEETVMPGQSEWLILILMGITTSGLAYFLWDIGVKRGSLSFLTLLCYSGSIISIFILILFDLAEPTVELIGASCLVSLGVIFALSPWPKIIKFGTSLFKSSPPQEETKISNLPI